jgi:hypothetical protein
MAHFGFKEWFLGGFMPWIILNLWLSFNCTYDGNAMQKARKGYSGMK